MTTRENAREIAKLTKQNEKTWAKLFMVSNRHTDTAAENLARDKEAAKLKMIYDITASRIKDLKAL